MFEEVKQYNSLLLNLQVIAFSDEEGVRFQSTFLGSAAIAGVLPVSALNISDKRFIHVNSQLYTPVD